MTVQGRGTHGGLAPPPKALTASKKRARKARSCVLEPGPRKLVSWADEWFDAKKTDVGNYRICGVIGSGKTHLIKMFIANALREVRDNPKAKLIVFDPKREFYSWIESLGVPVPLNYLFPSDERSVSLNFMRDWPNDIDSMSLAEAFYPQKETNKESQFWGQAFRTICAQVIDAIKTQLGYVSLRLVCLVLEDKELTTQLLATDPYLKQARALIEQGVSKQSENDTRENIFISIAARVAEMKFMAAHLDQAERQNGLFSLRDFVNEENQGILVLSKDMTYRKVQDPLNAIVMRRLMELMTQLQKDPQRKIFVVIDEFPSLGGDAPCPGIVEMLLELRSRGVTFLIAYQTPASLERIYGPKGAAEITGMCSNVVYLKQGEDAAGEQAAKDLGSERVYEKTPSTSSFSSSRDGNGRMTHGHNVSGGHHYHDRTIFSPTELTHLPLADEGNGIVGRGRSPQALMPKKPGYDYHDQCRPGWEFCYKPDVIDAIPKGENPELEYIPRDPSLKVDAEEADYFTKMRRVQRLEPLDPVEEERLTKKVSIEEQRRWDTLTKLADEG